MALLNSLAEFESLLENRPEHTRTYQIAPTIAPEMHKVIQAREIVSDLRWRVMNPTEMQELASYLEISVAELHGPFSVSDIHCHGCGRHLTILDIAKTSVDTGLHSKAVLAQVMTGHAGQWVTVRGQDGGRYADCAACGQKSQAPFKLYACPVYYLWA